MTYRVPHLMMKTVKFSKGHAHGFPNVVLALTFLLKVFTAHVLCVPKLQITHLKSSNYPLLGNYPQVKNLCSNNFIAQLVENLWILQKSYLRVSLSSENSRVHPKLVATHTTLPVC